MKREDGTDDPAWLAWRRAGVTATDVADAYAGTYGGTFNVGYYNQTSTASFALGSGFAGTLYVGIYGWGSPVGYTVSVPGNAPAPVPLPAPAALLLAGLGGLGAVARRPKSRRMA